MYLNGTFTAPWRDRPQMLCAAYRRDPSVSSHHLIIKVAALAQLADDLTGCSSQCRRIAGGAEGETHLMGSALSFTRAIGVA